MPFLKRVQNEPGLRKCLRKGDTEPLKVAVLIDKSMDDQGIGVH